MLFTLPLIETHIYNSESEYIFNWFYNKINFRDLNDQISEAKAAAGLGNVHLSIGDLSNALKYHELDLRLSSEFEDSAGKIRAFGNLGSTMEAIGNREESIKMFDRQLSVAIQMGDHVGQTTALGSLGKIRARLRQQLTKNKNKKIFLQTLFFNFSFLFSLDFIKCLAVFHFVQ
jgi:tetratricopeptide (TPR) repeat protein